MDKPVWDDHNQEDRVVDVSFFGTRNFMVALSIVAGLLGVIILYYLFSPTDPIIVEPLVVESGMMPFKIKPEEPGGVAIPYQDKQIYERLVPIDARENVVVLEPCPEQPIEIARAPAEIIVVETPPARPRITVEEITPPVEKVIVAEENILINLPKPVKAPKPVKKMGKYKIQVAALPTKALAEKEWGVLKRKYTSVLKAQNTHISKISLPKKGVFYRVQVGPFVEKQEAMRVCNALKKKGGSCFLVT